MGSHKHPNPKALAEAALEDAHRHFDGAADLLAKNKAMLEELRISAEREEERRVKLLLAAEEALHTAQEALACLDGNQPTPESLAAAISSISDSVRSLLQAQRSA